MKVLIKEGRSLNSTKSWYQRFIRSNVGKWIKVDSKDLKRNSFYLNDENARINNGSRVEIHRFDVEEVSGDARLGRSYCKTCGKIFITGKICKDHSSASMKEFFQGSKLISSGVDELVDEAFEELMPNI